MRISVLAIPAIITAVDVLAVLVISSNFDQAHAFVRNYRSPTTPLAVPNTDSKRQTAPTKLWYSEFPDTVLETNPSEIRKELESYGVSTDPFFGTETAEGEASETPYGATDADVTTLPSETRNESQNEDNRKTIREKWSSKWEEVASAAKEVLEKFTTESSADSTSDSSGTISSAEQWEDVTSAAKKVLEKYATGFSGDSTTDSVGDDYTGELYESDDQGSDFSSFSSPTGTNTRLERYEFALEEGRTMEISRLKQELRDRGITTGSFFEKVDLLEAYANAVADDFRTNASTGHNADSMRSEQGFDPSYRNVIVHPFDPRTLLARDVVIDIMENEE